MAGLSIFPGGVDNIADNVTNATQQANLHPSLHNQLTDGLLAVQTSLLPGGGLSMADHLSAADPHPQYLTQARGDARYTPGAITQTQADARYLQLAGGTLTGPLTLSGAPTQNLHAASKAYVDTTVQGYLTQAQGDARYAPIVGGGYLTQAAGDTRYLQLSGGTLQGGLGFGPDNSIDIGNPNRPRSVYVGTSVVTPAIDSQGVALTIGPTTNNVMNFRTNNVNRWQITNAALFAVADNSYDIGASAANRPRNVYVATQVFAGSGYVTGGTNFSDGFITSTLNAFAIRNGTNSQSFYVYNTWTDLNNWERVQISWASNNATISSASLGTGVARSLYVLGGANLYLGGNNVQTWLINTAGHFVANNDNANDIGASGANRPRNLFIGGYITLSGPLTLGSSTAGAFIVTSLGGSLQFGVNGAARWSIDYTTFGLLANSDNAYDIGVAGANRPRTVYVGTNVLTGGYVQANTGTQMVTIGAVATSGAYIVGSNFASMIFGDNATAYWTMSTTSFMPWTDNAFDLGNSTQRVRALYLSSYLQEAEIATPATPATGNVLIYPKADHKLYILDSTGTETQIGAGGGIPSGGTTGQVLTKNSATNYDASWQTPAGGGGGVTWPLTAPTGSVSSPSYGFTNSANTGIYSPATNQIAIAASGASVLTGSATGVQIANLGIGAAPTASLGLYITSAVRFDGSIAIQTNATAGAWGIDQSGTFTTGLVRMSGAVSATAAVGLSVGFTSQPSTTTSAYLITSKLTTTAGSFTLATGANEYLQAPSINNAAVTTMYGMYVDNMGNANIANSYGIYISTQSGSTGASLGLYNAGTSQLVGNVSLGSLSPNTSTMLNIYGSVGQTTGITQYGISIGNQFGAATTQSASLLIQYNVNVSSTTLATAASILLQSPSLSGSPTITNFYGLYIPNLNSSRVINGYGIYILAQSGASSTNIGLYNGGTTQLVGNVAIGGTAPSATVGLYNGGSTQFSGPVSVGTNAPSVGTGLWFTLQVSGTSQNGIVVNPTFTSSDTNSASSIYASFTTQATSYTLTQAMDLYLGQITLGAGSSVTTLYGAYVDNMGKSGITNAYGVYINAQSGAATTNLGLYNAGSTRLDGPIALGIAPNTFMWFRIAATSVTPLTGPSQYGIGMTMPGTSSVTSTLCAISVGLQGASGTFTTTNWYGVWINSPLIVSGNTVTNSYGLRVENQASSQGPNTNAYGIYVAAPVGATTANGNALFGDTGVGLTSSAQLATTATTGFLWIPSMAGPPTANPSQANTPVGIGRVALAYDSTDNRLYISIGGTTWHYIGITA